MQFSKVFLFATLALAAPAPNSLGNPVSDIAARDNELYIRQAAPTLSQLLSVINGQATGLLNGAVASVQGAAGDLTSTVGNTATTAISTVTTGLSTINSTLSALAQGLAANLTNAATVSVITTAATGVQEVKNIIGNATALLTTLNLISGNVTLNLAGVASGASQTITGEINAIKAITNPFTSALNPLISGLTGALNVALNIANPATVLSTLTAFITAITGFFH